MTEEKFAKLQEKFYEQQIETNQQLGKVAVELARVAALLGDTREGQADHEARIRVIEKWKYGVPISAVMGILSVIASIVIAFSKITGKP